MAGHGPPPKAPEERVSYRVPERGDWLTLPPLAKPVLPVLPRRPRGEGPWSIRTNRMWSAWRRDWVTGAYDPAEIAMAVELAYLYEDAVRSSKPACWAEARQWMDRLGLTMKGKRDLRLRLESTAVVPAVAGGQDGDFEGLRLVDEAV
jgi:hypothetical protein